jgi:protein-disulfide isomerase
MDENTDPNANETIESTGEQVTPKSTLRLIVWPVLVLLAFAAGLGAGYLVWARPLQAKLAAAETRVAAVQQTADTAAKTQAAAATQGANTQAAAQNEQVQRYPVPIDDDYIYGLDSAPITIIEFSDYQCPYCTRWHNEVWSKIKETYGDKVRLVYRDFPLYSIHPEAEPAAIAANCAGEQKKYYEYGDLLFNGGQDLGRKAYEAYAGRLDLNTTEFKKCLDEQRYKDEVTADYDYAANLGVRSTPTFFINGLAVVGAQPFEVFQQVIDMELAGEIP